MELIPPPRAHLIYVATLLSAGWWLGLSFAAPWLAAEHHYTSASWIYAALSVVCHQMPQRSFHWLGYPLGVCARCLGIYAGFVLGLLIYPLLRPVREESVSKRQWLWLAAAPTAIDLAGDAARLFANTFLSRTVTGLILGAVGAFYVLPALVRLGFDRSRLILPAREGRNG